MPKTQEPRVDLVVRRPADEIPYAYLVTAEGSPANKALAKFDDGERVSVVSTAFLDEVTLLAARFRSERGPTFMEMALASKAPDSQVMPHVNGKPFRCGCGGNVFTRLGVDNKYRCNGCQSLYIGE